MWLQQKDYTLSIDRAVATKDENLSKINLKVNNRLTTVTLEQLFLEISKYEFSDDGKSLLVRGWSILEKVKDNNLIIEDKQISISFHGEELGELAIAKIINPWCQMNDKKITDENLQEFYSKIIELSTPPALEKEEQLDEQAGEASLPQVEPPVLIINKSYENGKKPYLKSGYKEYESDNFRLLEKGEKTVLIELIDSNELTQYKKHNLLAEGFYQFIDENNARKINAKIIDGKLDITLIAEEPKMPEPEGLDEIELPISTSSIQGTEKVTESTSQ